jgi:hypothetical protein
VAHPFFNFVHRIGSLLFDPRSQLIFRESIVVLFRARFIVEYGSELHFVRATA